MKFFIGVALLFCQAENPKLPVPTPADQKKAETEVRSVFKEDFAKKTRDGKRSLAQRLLSEAADEKNSPTSRYVVLLLSRDLAVEALDVATLFTAIDQLGKLYDLAKPPLAGATFVSSTNAFKIQALQAAQKFAVAPEDAVQLAEAYLKVAEDTVREKLFDDALAAAQAAERYGKAARAGAAAERAAQIVREIPELRKEEEQFGTVITTKADDPAGKLVKGRYILFVIGDDKVGMENLLGCSDEGLKSIAKLETARPTSAEAMVDLAEAWLASSAKEENPLHRKRYRSRARHWFDEAMKIAGGITKARIEKRLAEMDPRPSEPSGGPVDLLRLVEEKDAVSGAWQVQGGKIRSPKGASAQRIQIPFAPPPEYSVTVVAERKEGTNCLMIGLSSEGRQFRIQIDGAASGEVTSLDSIDGTKGDANETVRKGRLLPLNRPVTILATVRKTGVSATVDGKTVIDWKGAANRLSLGRELSTPNPNALFLGCWDTQFEITKVLLTPISGGPGKKLR